MLDAISHKLRDVCYTQCFMHVNVRDLHEYAKMGHDIKSYKRKRTGQDKREREGTCILHVIADDVFTECADQCFSPL